MTAEQPELRVGDAERDDAIALLQAHLTSGRLDHAEFDERISLALQARTRQQLFVLFTDLPGRRPGESEPLEAYPTIVPRTGPPRAATEDPVRPWYAQWWMLLVAIGVAALTRGRMGPIVPLMALWIWVIWPYLVRSWGPRPAPISRQPLTVVQRREIEGLLARGEKIRAIKVYRESTGAGLLDAKNGVETMQRQLGY